MPRPSTGLNTGLRGGRSRRARGLLLYRSPPPRPRRHSSEPLPPPSMRARGLPGIVSTPGQPFVYPMACSCGASPYSWRVRRTAAGQRLSPGLSSCFSASPTAVPTHRAPPLARPPVDEGPPHRRSPGGRSITIGPTSMRFKPVAPTSRPGGRRPVRRPPPPLLPRMRKAS